MSGNEIVSTGPRTRLVSGFTLIELMVGMVIGLLSVVVITNVLFYSENQRRSTTSGSDAQVNGSLGLYEVQRQAQMAGYGLIAETGSMGCALEARFGGAAVAGFPARLVPLLITAGANGAPDTVRILASSKASYSIPVSIVPPGYDPNDALGDKATRFPVSSTLGFDSGDLAVAVADATQPCGVFQVTAAPTTDSIPRTDAGAGWNASKYPSIAYGGGAYLVNLGSLLDITYSISAANELVASRFSTSTRTSADQVVQSNIVNLQALYGKDTDADGVVDTYNKVTPTDNAGWIQVLSIRVALVARSGQFEKDEITSAAPLWDVGTATSVANADTCGNSKCLTLQVGGGSDWKHYRYKVFDTVIPLRNRLWTANKPP